MASGECVADFQSKGEPFPALIGKKVSVGGSDDQMEDGEIQVAPAFAFHAKGKSHSPPSVMGAACEMEEAMSLDVIGNAKNMLSDPSNGMLGLLPSPFAKFCLGMADHHNARCSTPKAQ